MSHLLGKRFRLPIGWMIFLGSSRTENGDFTTPLKRLEDFERVPQFPQRSGENLKIASGHIAACELLDRPPHHLEQVVIREQ